MKQPKALTRDQKELVSNKGLAPNHWMLLKKENDVLTIIHKQTNKRKVICI